MKKWCLGRRGKGLPLEETRDSITMGSTCRKVCRRQRNGDGVERRRRREREKKEEEEGTGRKKSRRKKRKREEKEREEEKEEKEEKKKEEEINDSQRNQHW